ncbi:MAG TPA: hypothetical protein VHL53_04780 [Acidimicrobiia bacterium]|nr:hypothetical protein [Acidimicrobiia bacterium]
MRLSSRIAVVTVAGFAAVGLASGGAWAYFTGTGTGTGTAHVGVVPPPAAATAAPVAPGATTVHVSWTAPASVPGGPALQGYFIERLAGSVPSPACGSSSEALLGASATSCADPAVAPGSYEYRVTAVYGTFTAAGTVAPVTVDGATA